MFTHSLNYLGKVCSVICFPYKVWASQVAQMVKNPPAMQETPVQFLGGEDLLEKG